MEWEQGALAIPTNKEVPLFFPASQRITLPLLSFLKLEKGGRKGGREKETEINSWGTQQYSCWFLPYLTETNPALPWFLSKIRYLFYGHFMSNPNGVPLMYVLCYKTLACLIICETIASSMRGKEVSQLLLLSCQLGLFLSLLLPQILRHFYREGESAWKQCTFVWIKCGCHENWPHSDRVDTSRFSWEKSVVVAWQEQPLLVLWGGRGSVCCKACSPGNQQILHRQELENETLFHWSVTEGYLMRSKRKVNRIILILNLCLPLCKDKVRSPSLPSSSTITHNRTVEWLFLTASP